MTPGTAYAFFDCQSNDVKDISETVTDAWTMTGQLPDVTIDVHDARVSDISDLLEPDAQQYSQMAKDAKLPYFVKMTALNQPGRAVADELGGTMNQVYNTHLYKEGDQFRAEIVYRNDEGVFEQY